MPPLFPLPSRSPLILLLSNKGKYCATRKVTWFALPGAPLSPDLNWVNAPSRHNLSPSKSNAAARNREPQPTAPVNCSLSLTLFLLFLAGGHPSSKIVCFLPRLREHRINLRLGLLVLEKSAISLGRPDETMDRSVLIH